MSASSPLTKPPHPAWYVLAGGLVAGTLDIAYAWAFWALKAGVSAQRIFQSVAAGLLGRASFEGGAATAALGLALHYFIATTMSVAYYLAARRWVLLRERALLCGAGYGLVLYGVMNYVVVPLSAAGPGSRNPLWIALTVAVHMVLIGVPIALATRRARNATWPEGVRPATQTSPLPVVRRGVTVGRSMRTSSVNTLPGVAESWFSGSRSGGGRPRRARVI